MVYGINNIPNFFWYFKRNIKYGDINNVIIKDRKDNFSVFLLYISPIVPNIFQKKKNSKFCFGM